MHFIVTAHYKAVTRIKPNVLPCSYTMVFLNTTIITLGVALLCAILIVWFYEGGIKYVIFTTHYVI